MALPEATFSDRNCKLWRFLKLSGYFRGKTQSLSGILRTSSFYNFWVYIVKGEREGSRWRSGTEGATRSGANSPKWLCGARIGVILWNIWQWFLYFPSVYRNYVLKMTKKRKITYQIQDLWTSTHKLHIKMAKWLAIWRCFWRLFPQDYLEILFSESVILLRRLVLLMISSVH